MPLQSSGAISMSQINAEFGRGTNLNSYRGTQYYLVSSGPFNFPSGTIKYSDFYGTQLNPPTPSFTTHPITEGPLTPANYIGFTAQNFSPGTGIIGSCSNTTSIGGRILVGFWYQNIKGNVNVNIAFQGDQTGGGGAWWTSGTYRGTTFYRSSTFAPGGNYQSGGNYTFWQLGASERPSFSGGDTYYGDLVLYP